MNTNDSSAASTGAFGRYAWIIPPASYLLLCIAVFYSFAFATHFTSRFAPLDFMDHYAYQANGFAHFKTYLADPAGQPIRAVDGVYFKEHTYSAYGILPAVFQLVLNNILGLKITSAFIVWALLVVVLLCFFQFLREFLGVCLDMTPRTAMLLSAITSAAIGSSDIYLHMCIVPYAWTQAAACGALFFLLAVWSLFRWSRTNQTWLLWVSGLCAGGALFSKQNYVLGFVPLVLFLFLQLRRKSTLRAALLGVIPFLMPVAAFVAATLVWNYARFGNPFDSGLLYVNASEKAPVYWDRPLLHRVPYNLYNEFLAGLRFRSNEFPLVVGKSSVFGGLNRNTGYGGLLHDFPMFSMFLSMPLIALTPVYLFAIAISALRKRAWRPADEWNWLFVAATSAAFFTYLLLNSSWMRYQFDLVFLWSAPALCALVAFGRWLSPRLDGTGYRVLASGAALVLVAIFAWTSFLGFDQTIGVMVGPKPLVHWPAAARSSDALLGRKMNMIRSALFEISLASKPIEAEIVFPRTTPDHAEPLILGGTKPGMADGIGVQYLSASGDQEVVTFFLDHWGMPKCTGSTISVTPGRRYRARFDLNTLESKVDVLLDGAPVLQCALKPYSTEASACGTNPIGFTTMNHNFSGQIECDTLEGTKTVATLLPNPESLVEGNPKLVQPAPGSTLAGNQAIFTWLPIPGAVDYWFDIGTEPRRGDPPSSGYTHGKTSVTVDLSKYPAGRLIYVQILTKRAAPPEPTPGSLFVFRRGSE